MVFVCQQTGNEYRKSRFDILRQGFTPLYVSAHIDDAAFDGRQSGRPTPEFEWFGFLLVAIYRAAFDTVERLRSGKAPPLTLTGLIAVQAPAGNPLSMTIFPFINRCDAGKSRAWGFGPKANPESVSSANERIRTTGDDKATAVFTPGVEAVIQ